MAKNQPRESCCAKISRNEAARIREAPQQPSDANAVRPHGNTYLFAAEKPDRRTDAANSRSVGKFSLEPVSKLFLCAAAGAYEEESWLPCLQRFKQAVIRDRAGFRINGGNETILFADPYPTVGEPLEIMPQGGLRGHDPE